MSRRSQKRNKFAMKPTSLYTTTLEAIQEDEELVTTLSTWKGPIASACKPKAFIKSGRRRNAKVWHAHLNWRMIDLCFVIRWCLQPTGFLAEVPLPRWVVKSTLCKAPMFQHVRNPACLTIFQITDNHVTRNISEKCGPTGCRTSYSSLRWVAQS